MYDELEYLYKNKSASRVYKHAIACILFVFLVIYVWIYSSIFIKLDTYLFLLAIFLYSFVFLTLVHLIHYFKIFKKEKKIKERIILLFRPIECLNRFFDYLYEIDTKNIVHCLLVNGLTHNEQLKIIINHYNSLIPKKSISSNGLLMPLLAILMSIITYVSKDGLDVDVNRLDFVIFILLLSSIFYMLIYAIKKVYDKFFGKIEMYKTLEKKITDFYFNFDDYKKTFSNKLLILESKTEIINYDSIPNNIFINSIDCLKNFEKYDLLEYEIIILVKINNHINKNTIYYDFNVINYNIKSLFLISEIETKNIKYVNNFNGKKILFTYDSCLKKNKKVFILEIKKQNLSVLEEFINIIGKNYYTIIKEL